MKNPIKIKLLDRYIGGEFLKAFALALAGLVMIFQVMNILDNLRMETQKPAEHVALYILFSTPQTTALVMPAALMFSVCFITAQFTVSREMVAIMSAGVPFFRGTAPILLFSALLCLFMFAFQNYVVTPSNELAARELAVIKKNKATMRDLVWQKNLRGARGYYFIYYLDKEKLKLMGGFNYLEVDGERPVRMLQAKGGLYRPASRDWLLENVRIVEFNTSSEDIQVKKITSHDKWETALPDSIEFFHAPSADPSEMTVAELWEEIRRRDIVGVSAVPYQVQFHANIAFPLMCIVVAVVGAVAGSMGNIRSGGPLFRSLLLSSATIFVYQLSFRLGQNLGNNGILPPALAAWGPTTLAIGAAGFLVYRNRK